MYATLIDKSRARVYKAVESWKWPPKAERGKRPMATVNDIPTDELLERAVRNARSRTHRKGQRHWRWVGVMDAFALGSTYAHQLCRRFNLDPEEYVTR
jgi:hypothetical protein